MAVNVIRRMLLSLFKSLYTKLNPQVIVIIWLLQSQLISLKVITLSKFHCTFASFFLPLSYLNAKKWNRRLDCQFLAEQTKVGKICLSTNKATYHTIVPTSVRSFDADFCSTKYFNDFNKS